MALTKEEFEKKWNEKQDRLYKLQQQEYELWRGARIFQALQRIPVIFGTHFRDANLSKLDFPDEILQKINDFLVCTGGFMFFQGTVGIGKTYCCAAIAKFYSEKDIYWDGFNCTNFFSKLKNKMNGEESVSQIVEDYYKSNILILDDLRFALSPWQKEIMFEVINARWENNRTTILTSNLCYNEIKSSWGDAFASRLYDKRNLLINLNLADKRV